MSALSALLERLRRMRPPPGVPAGAIGVPSAGEDVAAEVAFLFSSLDDTERRAQQMLEEAREQAEEIEGGALEQRKRILAEALERAEERAAALLAERREAYGAEAAAIVAEAEREAARVLDRGRRATPQLVEKVIAGIVEA